MNGVIYIDPRTMRASLTEIDGGMQYIPVSKAADQQRTIEFAVEMLLGFAESGIVAQLCAKKYRDMFTVALLACAVIVMNFTLGSGNVWVSVCTCLIWAIANAAIIANTNYIIWQTRQIRADKTEHAKLVKEMKEALDKRKAKPFE